MLCGRAQLRQLFAATYRLDAAGCYSTLLHSNVFRPQESDPHLSTSADRDPYGPPPVEVQRRVVVTGLGLVTPLGVGVSNVWPRLVQGETAVRALEPEDLPESQRISYADLPSKVVARVPQHAVASSPWAPTTDTRRQAPFMTYALCAAAEALEGAGWQPQDEEGRHRTGVAIGAGMSCTQEIADAGLLMSQGKLRRLSPFFVPKILANSAAGAVSIRYGFQGPNHAVSTACATGVHGIGDAFRMIRNGDADVMVAGGAEACTDAVSIGGFCRLKALSTRYNDDPARASRPFDAGRDGFVMGEGAGIMVLEELQHALERGAPMLAEVRGYGLSGDAHHITQPAPDGAGARLCMHRALAQAGVAPHQISYINAHATSTPMGDDIEQSAIAQVFGDAVTRRSSENIPVSSTKGATGHLLGAAGAVEAAFAVLVLTQGVAPPTVNLHQPEPHLLGNLLQHNSRHTLPPGPRLVLTNSFGFGGTNASLVFGTPPAM